MKFLKSNIFICSVFAILICIPSVLFAESEENLEKTYPFSRDGKVYLENISGGIIVKSWQKNEIKLLARKKAMDENSLDKTTIDINQTNGNIRVITRYDESPDFLQSMDVSVYYELLIPDKAQLRVKSVSGTVQIFGIGGRTDVETESARIEVVNAEQGVKCKTISGEIYIEGVVGNADLKSTSGKISANGLKGSVEANSVSGDIEINEFSSADEITMETIKGNMAVQGELSPGGIYEFSTISGRIELVLPSSSEFELQANTVNGNIQCDFKLSNYTVYTRNKLQGTIGKGNSSLEISSFSGDIRINKGM